MLVGVIGLESTMSEDGRFTVSCNSRYVPPQYLRKQKDWFRLSLFQRASPICNSTFGAFCEARSLSRGLVSFSESGRPITTAHPYFLLFDTAKLDRPDAAYLRNQKKHHKFFHTKKTIILDASKIISKFALNTNLLKIKVVKLNRIKAVLAETDKQGKWLA